MNAHAESPMPVLPALPPGIAGEELLDAVADGIVLLRVVPPGAVVEWVSRRFEHTTGFARDTLIGRPADFLRLETPAGTAINLGTLATAPEQAVARIAAHGPGPNAHLSFDAGIRPLPGAADLVTITLTGPALRAFTGGPDRRHPAQRHFGAIAEHLLDLVNIIDVDGTIRAQFGSRRISGRSAEERIGRSVFEFVDAGDVAPYRDWVARLAAAPAGTGIDDIEIRCRHSDGSWRVLRVRGVNLLDDPAIRGLLEVVHDETERKLAQLTAERATGQLQLAAEAVNGIIYEVDLRTGVVIRSRGVREVLGMEPDQLAATVEAWQERVHPDDVARGLFVPRSIVHQDAIVQTRYRVRHAAGHYVELLDRALQIRDDAGMVVRTVGCAIDVSRERRVERLLSEAEALAHVGSWELDLGTNQLTWSDETYRIHGVTRATYTPDVSALVERFAPDYAPMIDAAFDRCVATGEPYDLDVEIRAADGTRRWVRSSGRAEMVDGKAVRLYGATQDIDALKRSELRIQEQSDWLRLSMDAAQLLAWRWHPPDDRLVVEYRSPAFDPAVAVGATLTEDLQGVVPADRERVRSALYSTIATGEPSDIEFQALDRSNRPRWLAARIIRANADGGFVAIGTTQDISARRAAEDALRASEAVLRSVADSSPDSIAIVDPQLGVRFANRALRGDHPGRIIGRDATDYPADDAVETVEQLRRVLATGRPIRFETRVARDTGRESVFEHRVGPVIEGGRITGVIVHSTDITERRDLEREILEISNREQRRIGSDLHDGLGQELTGIALMLRGLASAVERGAAPRVQHLEEVVTLVNGAIETTRTLARGLSPVALEGGGLVYALRSLTARTREMYGLDIRFRSRVMPRVTLDAAATGHLYRIAQESLTNAARHARATVVTVQLMVRGRRVTLAVADDGRGLPGGASSGMGLKIMRYRAHMLGGELTIEPGASGEGTRVACTLLQPDPEPANDAARDPSRA
jgi:PAS domain S-box-containing protein